MTTPPTRTLLRAALATLALGGVTLAGAPAALAAPGDNGDVKVHRENTSTSSQVNEPHVGCPFYFAAFNFDGLQSVQYKIFPQPGEPGNQDDPIREGSITVNSNGDGHTGDINLRSGMYKVEWTWQNQQGAAKQKVFRVTCDRPNGNGGPGGGPGGHGKPPHGPVGAGGGGSAQIASEDSSTFGIGAAVAAGLAGTAGLVLIRRSRRRGDGAA
ncbi:hypothetical protein [Streptomyces sp. SJL17-1]|uniref:hypothetical protein n=1 Tax=Streptomyces sp. SJL17-1 TaxID=2967223 RepID=UPI002966CBE2|nr:hypothetical protein [Streptomyces sp. SJL17-1]